MTYPPPHKRAAWYVEHQETPTHRVTLNVEIVVDVAIPPWGTDLEAEHSAIIRGVMTSVDVMIPAVDGDATALIVNTGAYGATSTIDPLEQDPSPP